MDLGTNRKTACPAPSPDKASSVALHILTTHPALQDAGLRPGSTPAAMPRRGKGRARSQETNTPSLRKIALASNAYAGGHV